MYSLNSIINLIQQYEESLNKSESKYNLTGDEKDYLSAKNKIRNLFNCSTFKNSINCLSKSLVPTETALLTEINKKSFIYNTNSNLSSKITTLEFELRKIRKTISQERYQKLLKELIMLRNDFAQEIGFENYLELKYFEHGLDKNILISKINYHRLGVQKKYLNFINSNSASNLPNQPFSVNQQFQLAQDTLNDIGIELNFSQIKFYLEPDPNKISRACAVPITVPEEIHVIVNSKEVFLNLVVCIMHEIGHAVNLNYIDSNLNYLYRTPYNAALNEAVAIFFEKIILSPEWFKKYLNQNYPTINKKECLSIPILICCFEFEEMIYNDVTCNYDKIWENIREKYMPKYSFNWTDHHFFVTEPGYTTSYLMAEFLSESIKEYIINEHGGLLTSNTGFFLKNDIFKHGKLLNFQHLIQKINFV
ncbi:hypothetical protein [Abyssisolibacter fermentans]|uniref:hypothetical protein n=1 Tax=Abyssisolibacter fermentans TaxID=1766203 RepID=UPI000834580F|nr:hypothetical protein [Abyssisolibacter fermentans]